MLLAVCRRAVSELLPSIREAVREELAALAPSKSWLSVAEAAETAHKSVDTIRAHIKSGKLAASRPEGSREWRIREADLSRWLAPRDAHPEIDVDREVARALARFRQRGA